VSTSTERGIHMEGGSVEGVDSVLGEGGEVDVEPETVEEPASYEASAWYLVF
jgi:hypothetical protein